MQYFAANFWNESKKIPELLVINWGQMGINLFLLVIGCLRKRD